MADRRQREKELEQSLQLFHNILDPHVLEELQPSAPQAVYSTWVTVWLMVAQRSDPNATLQSVVASFLERMDDVSTNKRVREKTLSANTAGFSRARTRLNLAVANAAADHVTAGLLPNPSPALSGRRVLLMDGTTIALSSNDELRAEWPGNTNQHGRSPWPIVSLALAHELETGLAFRPEPGPMYGDEAESEVRLGRAMMGRLPARSVLLADRGFGIFGYVDAAVRAGHDVVARLKADRFQSMRRGATLVRPGVWKLVWKPTKRIRDREPELRADAAVEVYLHEFVGYSGQTLWIATTLADVATETLSALYARRAEIETDIRQWKKTLAMDAVRGQSVDMVRKELAVASVAYNLVVRVRALAAERAKVPPRRLSFAGVWNLVIQLLLQPRKRTVREWQEWFDYVLSHAAKQKLPNRPGRSFPRQAYTKRGSKLPRRKLLREEKTPKKTK